MANATATARRGRMAPDARREAILAAAQALFKQRGRVAVTVAVVTETMPSEFGAIGKVGRCAIVGPLGWMRRIVQAMGPLVALEMRASEMSKVEAARKWARGA